MKNIRLQFDVTEEKERELTQLMERAGVATKKDFFNNALTLLEWAIREVESGRTIASIDEQEMRYRELVMPLLEHLRKPAAPKAAAAVAAPQASQQR